MSINKAVCLNFSCSALHFGVYEIQLIKTNGFTGFLPFYKFNNHRRKLEVLWRQNNPGTNSKVLTIVKVFKEKSKSLSDFKIDGEHFKTWELIKFYECFHRPINV